MNSASWDIVLAGECMTSRPFSQCEDPAFLDVIERMRAADLTMAHLEMNFGDHDELDWPSRGDWIASFMVAEGEVADSFKWAGVDMLSLAHNHSFDWGASGILSTIGHCRRAAIAHAGTGRDLEEARQPAYRETRKGRASLVSVATGNKNNEWAGRPKAGMRGRPGVNPLRAYFRNEVDAEAMKHLRRVAEELGILYKKFDNVPGELRLQFPESATTRNVPVFVEGSETRVRSRCHEQDLAGNLRAIDEAMQMSDMVLVSHHLSLADGERGDTPPEYAVEFAHAAIDAGADIYIGHGWHRTLGIEIYKGKPILYGLGNFFAQSEFVGRVPADSYEAWGHDMDMLTTLNPAAEPLHPGLVVPTWWCSALFQLRMEDHRVKEIRLHPVEMGRDPAVQGKITRRTGSGAHGRTEGRPHRADPAAGKIVLDRLARLSAPFGTRVDIEDNVGVIRL
jgi:poly-gamma-glutamate synthesis protein (capsule biosynthesis protein)